MDFELTQTMDISTFQEKLTSVLPADIPIYKVEELNLKAPAANQLLNAAEYILTIATDYEITPVNWQNLIDTIKTTPEIWWEHTTKSGKNKLVNVLKAGVLLNCFMVVFIFIIGIHSMNQEFLGQIRQNKLIQTTRIIQINISSKYGVKIY